MGQEYLFLDAYHGNIHNHSEQLGLEARLQMHCPCITLMEHEKQLLKNKVTFTEFYPPC